MVKGVGVVCGHRKQKVVRVKLNFWCFVARTPIVCVSVWVLFAGMISAGHEPLVYMCTYKILAFKNI
jgi:hypothetical protein